MPYQKSKKIFIYIFLFFLIGTLNNKNFYNYNFTNINKVIVMGLNNKNNLELVKNLDFLKKKNLFTFDKTKIIEILNSNNLIEKYYVFKNYPSTLNIKIVKANFLAMTSKNGNNFFLGSNGKLIKTENEDKSIPYIFGDFKTKNFFELKSVIDQTYFNYYEIKNLFFFKSGRWDIETKSGFLIKLPKKNIKNSIEIMIRILSDNQTKKIKVIDLRQLNQIIINER